MSEYPEVTNAIKELRATVESRLDDCITREKAEKIAEDVVAKLHPVERKAVLPADASAVLEKAQEFKFSGRNRPEKPWESDYGRKFGNMRNFLLAAKERHPILGETKAMLGEGGSTGGGYLVPIEFSAEVIRLLADVSVIMRLANVLPMSVYKRQIPKQVSNVSVGWVTEGASKPLTNPTFGQLEQVAKVMAAVIKCSDELLRDSAINLTEFLSELVAEAMGLEIERVALAGSTAAGDPFNGILNTSGVNAVSMSGSAVSFDDIADLLFSLSEEYARDAVMVISRSGLKKLLKLRDDQNNYIWQPPAGNVPATIWNVPYAVSSQIPVNLGTNGDMTAAIFGRFRKYLLVSPLQGLEVKASQDAYDSSDSSNAFLQDQTWLRFTQAMSIDVAYGPAFSRLLFK